MKREKSERKSNVHKKIIISLYIKIEKQEAIKNQGFKIYKRFKTAFGGVVKRTIPSCKKHKRLIEQKRTRKATRRKEQQIDKYKNIETYIYISKGLFIYKEVKNKDIEIRLNMQIYVYIDKYRNVEIKEWIYKHISLDVI